MITMTPTIRANLFIWICIPLRLYLAWLPQVIPKYLKLFGFIIAILAIGTMYLALTNGRMNASEGGMRTWWAPFRYIHGALLSVAAIMLLKNDANASLPLAIDVIVGIAAFFSTRLKLPKLKI